jgi:hypothetical protein
MTDKDPKVEALKKIRDKSDRFTALQADIERAREELHEAIVEGLKVDVGPSEIERNSPYDRQHITRIRQAAGIPPKRAATVRAIKPKRAK